MEIKYKEKIYKIKDINTAKFRRDAWFLVADYYDSLRKYKENPIKAFVEFFYPVVNGEVVSRFQEIFEMFLENTDGISYDLTSENEKLLREAGTSILTFFMESKQNLENG